MMCNIKSQTFNEKKYKNININQNMCVILKDEMYLK